MSRIYEALLRAEQERQANVADPIVEPLQVTESDVVAIQEESLDREADDAHHGLDFAPKSFELGEFRKSTWSPEPGKMLFSLPHQNHVATEQFRKLRSKLYQERTKRPLKTLLVTSAAPGEGKTFVSANLGHAIGQQRQRRALIIDADLRRSALHKCVGAKKGPGLSEYLQEDAELAEVVQANENGSLYLIASGIRTADVELLQSGRMKNLLDEISGIFDWIIIDSPPATVVSDALTLSDYSDGILVVTKPGTPVEMVQKLRQELLGKQLLGVVFNRTERASNYYYYTAKDSE